MTPDFSAAPSAKPTLFGYLIDGLNSLGSLLIFAVMLLMCADILSRNLLDKPIHGVAELVAMSIVAIVFLQLASALRHGRMARADIFIDGFIQRRPRSGHAIALVSHLAGVFVCGVIFYATLPIFSLAFNDNEYLGVEGVFTAPTWPVRLIVLIGCAATGIQYLLLALRDLRVLLGRQA